MSFKEAIEKMKRIQSDLLEFLEDESDSDGQFELIIQNITNQNIFKDHHEFKSLLYLISNIGNYHHRTRNFIKKIEQILRHYKAEIAKYFSNSEIFQIFQNNKRILLFLFQEKIITINEYIISQIKSYKYAEMKYKDYFAPEINLFISKESEEKKDFQEENFNDKRNEGENDDYLCRLIRLDDIDKFIAFVEQTNLSLESTINKSIFETNPLLMRYKDLSLFEYAIFFGSIKIIKYMKIKGIELKSYMWYYAIHSQNSELIEFLENNHVSLPIRFHSDKYNEILIESIRCHHNDFTYYLIENLIKKEDINYDCIYKCCIECCNYYFFPENKNFKNLFFYLCEYDYYILVNILLHDKEFNIDINAKDI